MIRVLDWTNGRNFCPTTASVQFIQEQIKERHEKNSSPKYFEFLQQDVPVRPFYIVNLQPRIPTTEKMNTLLSCFEKIRQWFHTTYKIRIEKKQCMLAAFNDNDFMPMKFGVIHLPHVPICFASLQDFYLDRQRMVTKYGLDKKDSEYTVSLEVDSKLLLLFNKERGLYSPLVPIYFQGKYVWWMQNKETDALPEQWGKMFYGCLIQTFDAESKTVLTVTVEETQSKRCKRSRHVSYDPDQSNKRFKYNNASNQHREEKQEQPPSYQDQDVKEHTVDEDNRQDDEDSQSDIVNAGCSFLDMQASNPELNSEDVDVNATNDNDDNETCNQRNSSKTVVKDDETNQDDKNAEHETDSGSFFQVNTGKNTSKSTKTGTSTLPATHKTKSSPTISTTNKAEKTVQTDKRLIVSLLEAKLQKGVRSLNG
jgi:hypothetical protein